MRVAIVSGIHGNLTAFEAVLADLRRMAPDLILHGGDLADSGSSPVEIVDRIRDLGWLGVGGNGDEMLADPQTLRAFATREMLGAARLAWLGGLPRVHTLDNLALVHASPASCWRSPGHGATDAELIETYGGLGHAVAVYGHIHRGFIRRMANLTVANTGSVSLSYDGDPRASYLLLDDDQPALRRVEYDVERECKALSASGLPH